MKKLLLLLAILVTGLSSNSYAQYITTNLPSTYSPANTSEAELTGLQTEVTVTSAATTYLIVLSLKVYNTTGREVQITRRLELDDVTQVTETITATAGTHVYALTHVSTMAVGAHTWEVFFKTNTSHSVTLDTSSYLQVAAVNPVSGPSNLTTFNVRDFGADCDGTLDGDDTPAIELAIAAAAAAGRGTVLLPTGDCVLASELNITSSQDNVSIVGQGSYQTRITATTASGDILKVGDTSGYTTNITLRGFQIRSNIQKSVGTAALHLKKVVRSTVEDVVVEGQDLYETQVGSLLSIGFWFDGIDFVTLRNFQATADLYGVAVDGEVSSGAKADLFLSDGKIGGSSIGLLVGGAFGGLVADGIALSGNTVGIQIDQSISAETNRELFFNAGIIVDSSTGDGIVIAEPGAAFIRFSSSWIASNGDDGVAITNANGTSRISFSDIICFNNQGDCIEVADTDPAVEIMGGAIRSNVGAGIHATANNTTIRTAGVSFYNNTGGNRSGTFSYGGLASGQVQLDPIDTTNEGGEVVWKGAGAFTTDIVEDRIQDIMRWSDGTDTPLLLDFSTPPKVTLSGKLLSSGTAPTLSSCGSTPSISGNAIAGKVTIGSGATTSCTATFASAFANAPACVIAGDNTAVVYAATTSTTALTITSSADMASDVISYVCISR